MRRNMKRQSGAHFVTLMAHSTVHTVHTVHTSHVKFSNGVAVDDCDDDDIDDDKRSNW